MQSSCCVCAAATLLVAALVCGNPWLRPARGAAPSGVAADRVASPAAPSAPTPTVSASRPGPWRAGLDRAAPALVPLSRPVGAGLAVGPWRLSPGSVASGVPQAVPASFVPGRGGR